MVVEVVLVVVIVVSESEVVKGTAQYKYRDNNKTLSQYCLCPHSLNLSPIFSCSSITPSYSSTYHPSSVSSGFALPCRPHRLPLAPPCIVFRVPRPPQPSPSHHQPLITNIPPASSLSLQGKTKALAQMTRNSLGPPEAVISRGPLRLRLMTALKTETAASVQPGTNSRQTRHSTLSPPPHLIPHLYYKLHVSHHRLFIAWLFILIHTPATIATPHQPISTTPPVTDHQYHTTNTRPHHATSTTPPVPVPHHTTRSTPHQITSTKQTVLN
ncbi:hypothetical protein E2C01_040836 [Portunus trituberculatus]|uniref:Uncharacterized protein n=1 Tax=Portunus trituberculatus TaxID=210409 RepID=A0A5B7FIG2_PORTR|nr:hypothetical protein [Portunus trituberculatus]